MNMPEENQGIKRPHDEGDEDRATQSLKRSRDEGPQIELRCLIQSKNAGAIIGKAGANIKRLRQDFKASVTVPDSQGPERILTLGANLGTVCEMLMDVIPTLEDYQKHQDLDFECELRLLIHQSQAGCVIGRAGFKIKELRESTNTNIKVYSQPAPQSTDRCVAIAGKPSNVVNAVATIYELLETAPPKGFNNPYDPHNYDEYFAADYGGYSFQEGRGGRGGGRGGMRGGIGGGIGRGRGGGGGPRMGGDRMGASGGGMRGGRMGGVGGRDRGGRNGSMGGAGNFGNRGGMGDNMGESIRGGGGGMGGGRDSFQQNFTQDTMGGMGNQGMMFGNQSQTTTQVSIPKDLAGAIIGKGGSRIRQIRQESGAGITIDEALPGSNDRIITITGSQEQIQNAQYLLQMSVKQHSSKY